MSKAQIITIRPDGTAYGLRCKDGIDLRKFGKVETVRTTDILFDEKYQKYYFKFLRGELKGVWYSKAVMGRLLLENPEKSELDSVPISDSDDWMVELYDSREFARQGVYLFDEYEDAVAEEIRVVNKLRKLHGEDIV